MNLLKIFKAGFIWCGILLSLNCYGQTEGVDIPLGAMPMQLNPSFAGEAGAPRISSSVSYQKRDWGITKPYEQFGIYTSYDQFIPSVRTGIGIATGYRKSEGSFFMDNHNNTFLSLAVAPKISIKGKYTISPSLDFTYSAGTGHFINFMDYNGDYESLTSKAGLLFNTNKFYIGYSVFVLNQLQTIDRKSSWNSEGFKSYLQLGYNFQRSSESDFSFTPQIAFGSKQRRIYEENLIWWQGINFNFRYRQYIAGINNIGLHLGIQNEKLRLMFSSEFGLLSSNLPYTGNLSFRYIFNKADKGLDQSRF